jgi:hypothetical protein
MPEWRKPDETVPATDGELIKRVFDLYAGRIEARDGEVLRRLGHLLAGALMGSPVSRGTYRTARHRASESESIECRADGSRTPSHR